MMRGWLKALATVARSEIPASGAIASGKSAVAASGRASVSHHKTTARARPAANHPPAGMSPGAGRSIGISRRSTPIRIVSGLVSMGKSYQTWHSGPCARSIRTFACIALPGFESGA